MINRKSFFKRIIPLVFLLVALAITASTTFAQSGDPLTQLIDNEQWERAYRMAKELIKKEPANVQYLYQFGLACNKTMNYGEAVQPLLQVVRQEPNFPDGYNQLAVAYRNLNEDEKALQILEHGLNIFPSNHIMIYQLGTVLLKLNRCKEAVHYFELFSDLAPYSQADGMFMIGLCHKAMGEIEKAKETLLHVIALRPAYYQAYFEMATIYMEQKKFDNAIYYFEQTIKHDPRNVEALFHLGNIYSMQEKWQQARNAFYAIIDINPNNLEIYLNLAQTYFATERPSQAVLILTTAMNRFEPDADIYLNLGVAYGMQEMYDRECDNYLKAISLNPNYAPAYYNLGIAYRNLKQWDKSIEQFQQMLTFFPDDPDILSQIARTHFASGNPEKTEEILQIIEQINRQIADKVREDLGI
ncbi:MAG: tetratricopeptide repeat protein [Candidatus Auribacterota bacterium]|jgi:tetratricopeptide (TPR) repeat protein|nr:tetratricopeptide repeat protein [Candidatus Auribacterota bacterium]